MKKKTVQAVRNGERHAPDRHRPRHRRHDDQLRRKRAGAGRAARQAAGAYVKDPGVILLLLY